MQLPLSQSPLSEPSQRTVSDVSVNYMHLERVWRSEKNADAGIEAGALSHDDDPLYDVSSAPRTDVIHPGFLVLKWIFILWGLWPVDHGTSRFRRLFYRLWSCLTAMSYIVTFLAEIYWWLDQRPCITGAMTWEGRVAELAYLFKMAASWYTIWHLLSERAVVMKAILGDKQLFAVARFPIMCVYAFSLVYFGFTSWLYGRIFISIVAHAKTSHEIFRIAFLVLVYLFNIPFVASVVLFSIGCFHVRQQVLTFGKGKSSDAANTSDHESIDSLRDHFKFVCQKLALLGQYFNTYLNACHICGFVKYISVIIGMPKTPLDGNQAWTMNMLLAARIVAVILLLDFIGSNVSQTTRTIQNRIAGWRPVGSKFDAESGVTASLSYERHEHLMLLQHSALLETRNYHSLQILGFDLTGYNFVRLVYVLGVVMFYSVHMGLS